jgi:integrase
MVLTAAATALRRSEVRGLKWRDLDLEGNWFNLQRGLVRKHVTKMKTEASRRKLPMLPELADVLRQWHEDTAYPGPDEWVFASPVHKGRAPYWPDSILKDHIQPAAAAAGIAKSIGWHTFRHSLGTLLNENGENLKTIQDLLRHASSRVTADIYLHGGDEAKRSALTHMSGLFLVEKTA